MADRESPSSSEPVTNIVLVGRTGNGKSATGNTLLGENLFLSKLDAGGVTMECKMFRGAIQDGPIINVIDTPGLFDFAVPTDYVCKEIINCLSIAKEGIHVVLFILSARNRITQEEESTFNALQNIFEKKIIDYMIVVFTGGDELEYCNQTLEDYLRNGPEYLKRIHKFCGARTVLFNNRTQDKYKKAAQLKQLLVHVAAIKKQNGGQPYTNQMHRQIKEEGERLREQQRKAQSEKEAAETKKNHDEELRRIAENLERRLKEKSEAHERAIRELKEAVPVRAPRNVPIVHPFPQYRAPPPQCNIM